MAYATFPLNDRESALAGSAEQPARPSHARLFIALWPAVAERTALVRHRRQWVWSGKASLVRAERLHLTLHFIGALERSRIEHVAAGLQVPMSAFQLTLTHPDIWPRGIAVLRTGELPAALLQLHAQLGEALRALELPVEARRFRPHVTLARGAADATPPAAPAAVRWAVDGYVLVESTADSGGGYRILRRYG
ncbi:MAG: RNA 2',3'-cyclic phosphodiesterase [Candidatus Accumulibacter sp.]|nr:RNA 2',3'-cyclic phosphodiesterase [Accumulibacter sp.]